MFKVLLCWNLKGVSGMSGICGVTIVVKNSRLSIYRIPLRLHVPFYTSRAY